MNSSSRALEARDKLVFFDALQTEVVGHLFCVVLQVSNILGALSMQTGAKAWGCVGVRMRGREDAWAWGCVGVRMGRCGDA